MAIEIGRNPSEKLSDTVRRRGPLFLYLAAMVALAGSIAFFGWFRTWSAIIMWPVDTPYMDMRVIQSAIISAEHGLNPHVSNPADRWGNKIDYPLLWVPIGKALNFTDESSFLFICTGLVLCFVGVCSFLIFCFPSFGLLASLISTATLNGIERANNDLLIFCLLFLAALWFPKLWSPIPILLGTLLKLYPVFALGVLLIQRQFRLFVVSLAAAAAVFVCLWDQLAAIRSAIPVSCWISYGFPSIFECLGPGLPFWQRAGTYAAIGIPTLALAYSFSRSGAVRSQQGTLFNLMLIGASIYVGTFSFSSNWDYRLIFLIFCIPFLQTRPFAFAPALVFVIMLAMNETLVAHWVAGRMLTGVAKIAIFIVLGAYLIALALLAVASPKIKLQPDREKLLDACAS